MAYPSILARSRWGSGMRIGNGGVAWQSVGYPDILLDGKVVSIPDVVWADDEAGIVAILDDGKLPAIEKRGQVAFVPNPERARNVVLALE